MATEKSDRGVGDLIGSAYDARQRNKGLTQGIEDEEKARRQRLKLLDSLDWQPEYASQHVPTYQKTKSPIARSYLESMLLGQNPDATFEGATNAKYKKAAQARTMTNLYGNLPARAAEAKAVQAETPWKVTAPTRQIGPDPAARAAAQLPEPTSDREEKHIYKLRQELRQRGVPAADVDKQILDLISQYGGYRNSYEAITRKGKG